MYTPLSDFPTIKRPTIAIGPLPSYHHADMTTPIAMTVLLPPPLLVPPPRPKSLPPSMLDGIHRSMPHSEPQLIREPPETGFPHIVSPLCFSPIARNADVIPIEVDVRFLDPMASAPNDPWKVTTAPVQKVSPGTHIHLGQLGRMTLTKIEDIWHRRKIVVFEAIGAEGRVWLGFQEAWTALWPWNYVICAARNLWSDFRLWRMERRIRRESSIQRCDATSCHLKRY
ncbi:hypothetical protein A0H81_07666 [Grifola frondosa]|uniref:Uncharacterized protein n=1 Tax=Grifola frondosa TaxID=5627 RepID=A0A1C7M7R6_GRIFR|nr:hypothetical protein A0H81_07666 [Grifola frondosa]